MEYATAGPSLGVPRRPRLYEPVKEATRPLRGGAYPIFPTWLKPIDLAAYDRCDRALNMKIRRGKLILWALMGCAASVLLPVAWWGYRFYFPPSGPPPEVKVAALVKNNDPNKMLAEANQYYWTHNLPVASRLYERAEELFVQAHDERNALYAKVGLVRSELQLPFAEMSDFLAAQLKTPTVQNDAPLRLWCLGVKGDADLEVNAHAARQDWEQAKGLADQLGEKEWANRATGELGLVSFLEGNYQHASYMVGHTLLTAIREGDIGTQVRYLARIIHVFEDTKSLLWYKHVVDTMFERPKRRLSLDREYHNTVSVVSRYFSEARGRAI